MSEIITIGQNSAMCNPVVFSQDGSYLAFGLGDGSIKLWEIINKTILTTLNGHNDEIISLRFSPDRCLLASGSGDSKIILWKTSDWS
jgi:WD40 repeat protein